MDGTFLLSTSNSYHTLRHIKNGTKETSTMRNFDYNHGYDGHKLCLIFIGNFLFRSCAVMYVYYLSRKSDS